MSTWQLELLGTPFLQQGASKVKLGRKTAGLLAYLALQGPASRVQLAKLFWPDLHHHEARNDLRQLIHELRRFPELVAAGDPLELVNGYHAEVGDVEVPKELLAGLEYDDCPEFNEWLTYQRQKLWLTFVSVHESEVQRLERRGELTKALTHARVLLNAEPFSETAHRRVMRLHVLNDNRAAALDTYHDCHKVLQQEFGIGPSPETVALAHEIDQGTVFPTHLQPQLMPSAVVDLPAPTSSQSDGLPPLDNDGRAGSGGLKKKGMEAPPSPDASLPKAGYAVLHTKLYIPQIRDTLVLRPRLIKKLNEGAGNKLTIICAPAGFGKTTLVSGWVAHCERQAAWLSLDAGDNDPVRFLTHLVAALQTIATNVGEGALDFLQSPQTPPTDVVLTALLNEIATIPEDFVLVLDDYHIVDAKPVDKALTFLLEHLPPQMHLVIATREDPNVPLARLRARGQLTELRAADLRFTRSEAAEFLKGAMGLDLSAEDIALLETRTEGWVVGLQLAALSMQGHQDATGFIKSFTGSHHFVLDYLLEEVLQQQPESVQTFLLRTSILDQLCGPLCDVILQDPATSGQAILEHLEHANMFITPLDDERRWYRYHHLFAELLRQRLHQSATSSTGDGERDIADLHRHASQWYEDNGLEVEAFQHAAAAYDLERAERLIEGEGVPLYFRGTVAPVLKWLESLPKTVLDARPSLWMMYASVLLFVDHTAVEGKLQSVEASLQGAEADDRTRDLIGRIASMRATLAVIQNDAETIIAESRRALAYLHPDNRTVRTAATWSLGYAHQLQGDRVAATQAYTEVITIGESFGDSSYTLAATINLGQIQEANNQLALATRTYKRALQMADNPPQLMACNAHLGLARICYQWNDLDTAQQCGQHCFDMMRQMGSVDTFASYEVFLAHQKLAQRDAPGAAAVLNEAEAFVREHNFMFRMPEVTAAQVLTLLRQGHLTAADHLAEKHNLPISQARVHLAQGEASAALAVLEPLRQQAEVRGWPDKRLAVMVLQAIAAHVSGDKDKAMQVLGDALELAEPGNFIRIFVDEGLPMVQLLSEAAAQGIKPGYIAKLLAAFEAVEGKSEEKSHQPSAPLAQSLLEPLSNRELEVLGLIAQGLSNREISGRLFRSLDTVKGHNRIIFSKLQVQSRTEAVARARELGLF